MRIATPVNRSLVRNDKDFCKGCGGAAGDREGRPYGVVRSVCRRRENREAPTRVPPWGSIDSLRFDTAAGEILFYHQSYLEGDSVVEFTQVQACELFDLLQAIDQGIAVNEELPGGLGHI